MNYITPERLADLESKRLYLQGVIGDIKRKMPHKNYHLTSNYGAQTVLAAKAEFERQLIAVLIEIDYVSAQLKE